MIQLYFLSILLNGLSGCILLMGDRDVEEHIETSMRFSFRNQTFQFILGIFCAVTGILKLLLPYEGIPVFGDLFSALAGIAAGFILIFGFYREHDSRETVNTEGKLDRLGEMFLRYKKVVGIVLFAAAVLHFLFPKAILL